MHKCIYRLCWRLDCLANTFRCDRIRLVRVVRKVLQKSCGEPTASDFGMNFRYKRFQFQILFLGPKTRVPGVRVCSLENRKQFSVRGSIFYQELLAGVVRQEIGGFLNDAFYALFLAWPGNTLRYLQIVLDTIQ